MKPLLLFLLLAVAPSVYPLQGAPADSANIFNKLAADVIEDGKLEEASRLLNKALEYPGTDAVRTAIYNNLGVLAMVQWDYAAAEKYFHTAEQIARKMGDHRKTAIYYNNLAYLYGEMRDYQKAIGYIREAIATFTKLNLPQELSSAYLNLGLYLAESRKYTEAFSAYQQSLRLNQGGNAIDLSSVWRNMAEAYQAIGKPDSALRCYRISCETASRHLGPGHYITGANLLPYAGLLIETGAWDEANQILGRAATNLTKNFGQHHYRVSECYQLYGQYYETQGRLVEALGWYHRAIGAADKGFASTSVWANPDNPPPGAGRYLLSPLQRKAETAYRQFILTGEQKYLYLADETCALIIRIIGDMQKRFLGYESKMVLAAAEHKVYPLAADIAYRLYTITGSREYLSKIFAHSEAGKASVLLNMVQSGDAVASSGLPDSVRHEEQKRKRYLAYAEEKLYELQTDPEASPSQRRIFEQRVFEARNRYESYISQLESQFPKYYKLKYQTATISATEAAARFSGQNIINYTLTDSFLITILVNRKEVQVSRQAVGKEFFTILREFIDGLHNLDFMDQSGQALQAYCQGGEYLYRHLLAPLAGHFDSDRLTIIPDGPLADLPFETLIHRRPGSGETTFGRLPYLLHKYDIHYAYSATVLADQPARSGLLFPRLLAIAPSYPQSGHTRPYPSRQAIRGSLEAIPGAREEAEAAGRFFNGKVLTGKAASERSFREQAPEFDVLHLAMHTFIDNSNPMLSKLVFAWHEDDNEDGFLNTYELFSLTLNARMAVLSACKSGSGQWSNGEGMISLARGFAYSGCPSIVHSLWEADDKASLGVMKGFYHYLGKGWTKSQALRQARIDFLESADQLCSHPYFWGAYIVTGSDDPVCVGRWWWQVAGVLVLVAGLWVVIARFRKRGLP